MSEDTPQVPASAVAEIAEHLPEAKKAIRELLAEGKNDAVSKAERVIAKRRQKPIDPKDVYHTLKFVEDVPLQLFAEVARTKMPLREILSWKEGSSIRFDKVVGEPVDVLIEDRLIARGEVVVVNDRFGVRISEITRPDEKVGSPRR